MPSPSPHPAFRRFEPWRGIPQPGCQVNFLGVQTSIAYSIGMAAAPVVEVATDYPPADEEMFEWIDLLEAVSTGTGVFTMIELGAGWGRWLANAAAACRAIGREYRLIGVEAEPTHFALMREHLERSDVDMAQVSLIEAAVAGTDGKVTFRVGSPFDCYGQRIVRSRRERIDWRRDAKGRSRRIRAVSLTSIFDEAAIDGLVDLIDLDVQSAEADVLEPAASLLHARVRRVHVGTHDPRANEDRLRALFNRLGWTCLADYPWGGVSDTPFGSIAFQDGVQSWLNPALAEPR